MPETSLQEIRGRNTWCVPGALAGLTGLPTDSTAWIVRASTGVSTVGGSPVSELGYGFRVCLEMEAEFFDIGDPRDAGRNLPSEPMPFESFCAEAHKGRYLLAVDWEGSRNKQLKIRDSHAIAVEVMGRDEEDVAFVHSLEPFKRMPVTGRSKINEAMGGIEVIRGWRLIGKSRWETW